MLLSMKRMGLILAPEVVEWHTGVDLGTPNPVRIKQRRISFTELVPNELGRHSVHFGPFALEFNIATLRQLGALPVVYMPQALGTTDLFSLLGPFIVGHLDQIRGTLDALNGLDQFNDPGQLADIGATHVADNAVVTLKNGDGRRGTIRESQVSWNSLNDLLEYVKFERAPFAAMLGVTSILQSMFYPTDDEHHDLELGYYRQREWRITGDYNINGSPRSRELSDGEKLALLDVDKPYWSDQTHSSGSAHRVDEALVLVSPKPQELFQLITRVVVPDALAGRASQEFGDRVTPASGLRGSDSDH